MLTIHRRIAAFLLVAGSLGLAGCTISKDSAPDLAGPSEFGTSVILTATPDSLSRDGSSIALVKVTVVDAQNKPMAGQRVSLNATTGTLSAGEVTTDSKGEATATFTSPSSGSTAASATITATPISATNAVTRTVSITLSGPPVPTVSFSWTPASPNALDLVTFDASATTLSGVACQETCIYAWDFNDGNSSSGRVVTHRFGNAGNYLVRLTVSAPGGVIVASTRTVVVGQVGTITAAFTYSPTNPKVGDTVFFDGTPSTTPDGVAIVTYQWDFGNGTSATGKNVSASFNAARTWVVRLTVTDALGRTATTTVNLAVST